MTGVALVRPQWAAPARVAAASSERTGGSSGAPFHTLNLGTHVGDAPRDVAANRASFARALTLPGPPCWLEQVHGTRVVIEPPAGQPATADAAVTRLAGRVLAILTADCLPVLLCSRDGDVVGAAHAGWRGLAHGILERTVAAMGTPPRHLLAWLGPAIGPEAFEVGPEVRAAFTAVDAGSDAFFRPADGDRFYADLAGLARHRLCAAGLDAGAVYAAEQCTFSQPERFFSYRRDGACGRMASVIWLQR